MKKTCKTIASLVMMLVLLLGIGAPAYALDGNVTYEGGAEKFVFTPGSGYTDTDLFDGFKGVMPGDELVQIIEVKNGFFGTGSVNIYLRAVAHDEVDNPLTYSESFEDLAGKDQAGIPGQRDETVATMSDFLSQLSMQVYKQDGTCIFSGSPNELDGLKNNVLLANVPRGKSITSPSCWVFPLLWATTSPTVWARWTGSLPPRSWTPRATPRPATPATWSSGSLSWSSAWPPSL